VLAGTALLGVKFYAYRTTGSAAILSDAMESIVNIVAAAVALGALVVASWPADRNHPYGHGKIEFMTAAFEGGLIAFAALLIIAEATGSWVRGVEIRALDQGIVLTLIAGAANYVLGAFLIRTGRDQSSITLVADGKHVQADFWTSAGVAIGLGLVMVTGRTWIDPLVAILVGLNLALTGWRLVREAAGGLLDEEDPALLRHILQAITGANLPGVIRVHFLRAIRSGNFRHVDTHLVVPEYWSVERAHELADELERRVTAAMTGEAEIAFHIDPCRRNFCSQCDVADCPIRLQPFVARRPITLEEATMPDTSE
jgi:cation diffusion facilitator family transporter